MAIRCLSLFSSTLNIHVPNSPLPIVQSKSTAEPTYLISILFGMSLTRNKFFGSHISFVNLLL